MVYLAREEGSAAEHDGRIEWVLDLNGTDYSVGKVSWCSFDSCWFFVSVLSIPVIRFHLSSLFSFKWNLASGKHCDSVASMFFYESDIVCIEFLMTETISVHVGNEATHRYGAQNCHTRTHCQLTVIASHTTFGSRRVNWLTLARWAN